MDSCTLDFRGCSRSFVSLLHTVVCPSRCLLTCPMLQSGGAGLFRTQLQVYAVEKCVFLGVVQLDPQMDSCALDFRSCSRSFVSLLHTVACPSRCLLACATLPSGGAGLVRTQLHGRAVDKHVYLGVVAQDPQMKTCRNVIDCLMNSYTKFMCVRSRLPHGVYVNTLTVLRLISTCDTVYIM